MTGDAIRKKPPPNKIQLKIQRIIQASNSNLLSASASQVTLASNGQEMLRPQSLKQLMPTIDEQIMRLTEMSSNNTTSAPAIEGGLSPKYNKPVIKSTADAWLGKGARG